jgi:hypothetical protein
MPRLSVVHRERLVIHCTRHAVRRRRTDAASAFSGCVVTVLRSENVTAVKWTADIVDQCPGTTRIRHSWDWVCRLGMAVQIPSAALLELIISQVKKINSERSAPILCKRNQHSIELATHLVVETAIVVV